MPRGSSAPLAPASVRGRRAKTPKIDTDGRRFHFDPIIQLLLNEKQNPQLAVTTLLPNSPSVVLCVGISGNGTAAATGGSHVMCVAENETKK